MPTILIIDDSPAERALLSKTLEQHGFTTECASDGSEGEIAARASLPDLILLDVVMPGRDGFQTCRALKKSAETGHIPIIILSSKRGDSDRFWGMKQGAVSYLVKPCQVEELLNAVREQLPTHRA